MKTYKVLPKQSDKSYFILVTLSEDSSFKLKVVYNHISDSYMGTMIECFADTIRAIQNTIPNFFDEFEESDARGSLKKLGFTEVEPNAVDLRIYG
jgi:hypothetical protein